MRKSQSIFETKPKVNGNNRLNRVLDNYLEKTQRFHQRTNERQNKMK